MSVHKVLNDSNGLGKPVQIALIVLAILVVGTIGYVIGTNQAESDVKAKYDEKTQSLQKQVDEAKEGLSDTVQEGQEAVEEGKQTLESLQAENSQLKSTIDELNKKIVDLEKQLEDAQSGGTAQ